MYLKSINDQTPCAALGICSQHYFFAYVFEIESKCCASSTSNKEKIYEKFLLYSVYDILKEIILPVFEIQAKS